MADLLDSLRQRMAEAAMSQAELSRRSGVAESVLSRFRRGERDVTIDVAERIAAALGYKAEFRRMRKGGRS